MNLREESITLKELLPIVIACALWGRGQGLEEPSGSGALRQHGSSGPGELRDEPSSKGL